MKDNALYLEADEDITSAIDKLGKSPADSVQIVVPKRSTMLQSIINLKLLKKAAESHGKELVLVTNDKIATELASRVGLGVAPSLGAKAVLAKAETKPKSLGKDEEIIESDEPEEKPEEDEGPAAVAAGAAMAGAEAAEGPDEAAADLLPDDQSSSTALVKAAPVMKRRELGDSDAASDGGDDAGGSKSGAKGPAMPKLKIPDFGVLQKRLLWVGLLVVLIAGYWAFMYFGASAKVVLDANGTKTSIDTTFAVDTGGGQSDLGSGVLAGQKVTFEKDLNSTFTPTGQQDVGTKATGQMTVYNCNDASDHPLQAGTRFAAPDGKIFRSTDDISVGGASIGSSSVCPNGGGFIKPGTATVNVTADQNGDSYNEAAANYTIVAYPAGLQSTIFGKGSQMTGGTTKTVTVVSQSDVDNAKAALLAKDQGGASNDLSGKLPKGYMAVPGSQSSDAGNVQSSPAVGSQGDTATLTIKANYTVLAVKKSDYDALIQAQEQKQVGDQNQIYDDGQSQAQVTSSGNDAAGRPSFHFTTDAISGTKIDTAAVAKQLRGQRYGDAVSTVKGLPGVSDANITLWPAWSSSLPSRPGKIKVTIQANNK
jgi:hypothetical protein